jgi:hypothetical protein
MTMHPVIGGAKDTILGTYQQVSAAVRQGLLCRHAGERGLSIGGVNGHPEKPDDRQCTACERSFIGSGTEQPHDWRPSAGSCWR